MQKLMHRLKARRVFLGMSQKDLAMIAGISQPTIAQIEIGNHIRPHPSTINALAKALDVKPAWLRSVAATATKK